MNSDRAKDFKAVFDGMQFDDLIELQLIMQAVILIKFGEIKDEMAELNEMLLSDERDKAIEYVRRERGI